jgi:glycine/D-amino acid oxidase-like deaminating enzyme
LRIAIVGGGIFGVMTAIRLAENGQSVTLYERLPALMNGTSRVGNRLHLGFHYPRHEETALQSMRGYPLFEAEFGEAILGDVTNAYFIASNGSLTSPDAFLAFCDRLGLPYERVDPARFSPCVTNVDLGIVTKEGMYDPFILSRLLTERLAAARVNIRVATTIEEVRRGGKGSFILRDSVGGNGEDFDALVNCTYANANRLAAGLGLAAQARQYEYTVIPIVELPQRHVASITVLDGPFICLLPYGNGGDHLLYHVDLSVIARENGPFVNQDWFDPSTAPFASMDRKEWLERIVEIAATYVPEVREMRVKGLIQFPRAVLANAEFTDARPTLVSLRQPGYVEVFSGKIVHCMWVPDEVSRLLGLD